MTRIKKLTATALVAATVAVGGLAATPEASAAPKTCAQAVAMARAYTATGDIFFGLGNYAMASSYYGRAQGVLEAAC